MSTFNLHVVALDKVFYDGPCDALTLPAVDGEKGVLASHEPMVMAITAGEMRITAGGEQLVTVGQAYLMDGDAVRVVSGEA